MERPLLFNVEQDPPERIDRRAEEAAVVEDLRRVIDAFAESVNVERTFWGAP